MATERKIYTVTYGPAAGMPAKATALISATSAGRAEKHVARDVLGIKAEYAEQATIVKLVSEGVKVQEAKED